MNLNVAEAEPAAESDQATRRSFDRRLFLIHIPKTAGTTVNHLLSRIYGEGRVLLHIESQPQLLPNLAAVPPETRYVSGHLRLPTVLANLAREQWFVFALLRNPVRHLISHLKWVKALAAPGNEDSLGRHSEIIQAMAWRLWDTSLNDIDAIHRFVHDDFAEARQLFDNCQVRYLIAFREGFIDAMDAHAAAEALGQLDYVGLTESFAEVYETLSQVTGIRLDAAAAEHMNRARIDETVDLDEPAIRDFYCDAVRWDAMVYSKVRDSLPPAPRPQD
jgi:hypothetical protein